MGKGPDQTVHFVFVHAREAFAAPIFLTSDYNFLITLTFVFP